MSLQNRNNNTKPVDLNPSRHCFDSIIRGLYLGLLLSLLLLGACDQAAQTPIEEVRSEGVLTDNELRDLQEYQKRHSGKSAAPQSFGFGFDLRASPQEDTAQYLPFLDYLTRQTGYRFNLHFTPKYSSNIEELGKGKIAFSAMGAVSFLKAQRKYGAIPLARGLNLEGKAEYQSVFVVRPDSKIGNFGAFKGRALAFGSRDSTQGHLIPRIMLMENHVSLEDLSSYIYTGSHQKCAEAVVSGRADICGMQDQLARQLQDRGQLKIIIRSNYYPSSGIVASRNLDLEVIAKVKQALIAFKPQGRERQSLYHWERTEMPLGFVAADPDDYAELRRQAQLFGFLGDSQADK